jgi:hypothetical protein
MSLGFPWISLDFSRPNRDFSMGYAAWSEENLFLALFPAAFGAREREPVVLACEGQDCSWAS